MSVDNRNTANLNKPSIITRDQNNSYSSADVTDFNKAHYTQDASGNTELNPKKTPVAKKDVKSADNVANYVPASTKNAENKEGSKSGFQLLFDIISSAWQKCKNFFLGISEIDLVVTAKESSAITKEIVKAISKMGQEELEQKIEQELDREVESLETKPDRLKRKLEILTELIDIIVDMNYSHDNQGIDNIDDILYSNLARAFRVKKPNSEVVNNFYSCLKNIFNKYIKDQISDMDFSAEFLSDEIATYEYVGETVTKSNPAKAGHTRDSLEKIMIEFGRDIPRGFDKFKIKVDGEIIFDSITDKKFNKEMHLMSMTASSAIQADMGFKIVESIILPKILEAVDASNTKLDKDGKDQLVRDLLTQMYQAGLADNLKTRDSAIEGKKKGRIAKDYSLQFPSNSDHTTTEISVETDNDRITVDNYFNAELNLVNLNSFSDVARTEKLYSYDTRLICKTDGTKPYFEYIRINHASNVGVAPIAEELLNLYNNKDVANDSQDYNGLVVKLERILATKSDMPNIDNDNVFTPTERHSLKINLINELVVEEKNDSKNAKKNMVMLKNRIEDFLIFLEKQKQMLAIEDQKKIMGEIIEILKSECTLITGQISEENSGAVAKT